MLAVAALFSAAIVAIFAPAFAAAFLFGGLLLGKSGSAGIIVPLTLLWSLMSSMAGRIFLGAGVGDTTRSEDEERVADLARLPGSFIGVAGSTKN